MIFDFLTNYSTFIILKYIGNKINIIFINSNLDIFVFWFLKNVKYLNIVCILIKKIKEFNFRCSLIFYIYVQYTISPLIIHNEYFILGI